MLKLSRKTLAPVAFAAASLIAAGALAQDAQNKDYRTVHASGKIDYGKIGDSFTADLVLYLAGNQFMVMEELIKDFQKKNPHVVTIYVETIPPGQIFNQIVKGGKINDQETARNPDVYASVNLGHLKKLKAKGLMETYLIYTHNKLELMVAEGDIVAAEVQMNAKTTKGLDYQNQYVFLFTFRDGKITEFREHLDTRYAASFLDPD